MLKLIQFIPKLKQSDGFENVHSSEFFQSSVILARIVMILAQFVLV